MMFSFKQYDIAEIRPFQAANVDGKKGDIILKNYPFFLLKYLERARSFNIQQVSIKGRW
jgi:hypothetical protein